MKLAENIFEMITIVMNEVTSSDAEFFESEEECINDLNKLANGNNADLLEVIIDFIETDFDVDAEFISKHMNEIKLLAAYNAAILLNKTPLTLDITL